MNPPSDRYPNHASDTAQPGVALGSPDTAGPMVAALYGELTPYAWHDPEHDAYQLFHQRSVAMGWLDDRSAGGTGDVQGLAPGLWGMNDAGWEHPRLPETGLVSWFQVEASAVALDRPLPVRPFLKCAKEATARKGKLHLSAVQVLLPVGGLDSSARPRYATVPSMLGADWFGTCARDSRTPVEVTISSGRNASLPMMPQRITEALGRLEQDVFLRTGNGPASRNTDVPAPFDDSFWGGPPEHGVVWRGELAEWSCDAIGWLAEVAADLAAGLGVRSPLLFTAQRPPTTGGSGG